jgi:hypothetical protein
MLMCGYLPTDAAASITKSATSFGCESIGRWLLASVRVLAFILFAVAFSCSGEIARSFEAITNQLGFVLLRWRGSHLSGWRGTVARFLDRHLHKPGRQQGLFDRIPGLLRALGRGQADSASLGLRR